MLRLKSNREKSWGTAEGRWWRRKERLRTWERGNNLKNLRRRAEFKNNGGEFLTKEERRSGVTSPRSKRAVGTINLHYCHHFSPPSSPADLHRGISVMNSCQVWIFLLLLFGLWLRNAWGFDLGFLGTVVWAPRWWVYNEFKMLLCGVYGWCLW